MTWHGASMREHQRAVETSLDEGFLIVIGGRRFRLMHWHGAIMPASMVSPRSNRRTGEV